MRLRRSPESLMTQKRLMDIPDHFKGIFDLSDQSLGIPYDVKEISKILYDTKCFVVNLKRFLGQLIILMIIMMLMPFAAVDLDDGDEDF